VGEQDSEVALKLLDGVVEEEFLTAYLKLLAADGCAGEDAEELLGTSELVRALTSRGMAYLSPADPANPLRLIPAPAYVALQAALAELGGSLRDHHNRLLTGHQRLGDFQHERPQQGGGHHPAVQVVTDRAEINRLSYSLISTARRDWMTLDNLQVEAPIDETTACPPLPRFQGSVRCRSVYETACVEHPVGAKAIELSVEAGEEARVLPRIGMKLILVDDAVAMLPLTPTGMGGALILRSAVIIAALREYFEMLWERAAPITSREVSSGPPITGTQQQVLRLLAQGLKDEAIARRTGTSVQTVRRHAATLKDLLDVETRFAAGAAAIRRGWIQ
jgi:DNA-binding CsgD family transcriptional regulator